MQTGDSLDCFIMYPRCTSITAAVPVSEGEAIVLSPTYMAAAKIVTVNFVDLH